MAMLSIRTSLVCALLGVGFLACGAGIVAADQIQAVYNLAPGASSAQIIVPAINRPVSVTCSQNNGAFRGIGQMTLLRVAPAAFLEWVGIDTATNQAVSHVSADFSTIAGTHMIYCDSASSVDIQVFSAAAIQVKNTNAAAASGVINFVW